MVPSSTVMAGAMGRGASCAGFMITEINCLIQANTTLLLVGCEGDFITD